MSGKDRTDIVFVHNQEWNVTKYNYLNQTHTVFVKS